MRYGRYARSEDVAKTRREATISAPRSSHLSPAEVRTIAVPWRCHGRMMGGHLLLLLLLAKHITRSCISRENSVERMMSILGYQPDNDL
jgi:hypothetical protein